MSERGKRVEIVYNDRSPRDGYQTFVTKLTQAAVHVRRRKPEHVGDYLLG